MIKQTRHLFAIMNEALEEIALSSENNLQYAERSYQAVQSVLQQLKDLILNHEFKDREEEVLFFKEVKPQFLRELIYYMKVFYIEAGKPVGDKDLLVNYYKSSIDRINTFFERNHSFYIYYRMGKNEHDHQYFVRVAEKHELLPEYSLDIDPRFTTIHSSKLAKIQAYERLNAYLQQEIFELNDPMPGTVTNGKKEYRNLWTDTKAALIELAYALYSRGAVNHGKGDIRMVMAALEKAFNIEVGNFYRTFQGMRIRKKNRTPFLNALEESLERWMDNTDLGF